MEIYFKEINNYIIKIEIQDYPEDIRDKVEYYLQDGKRLRPILCLLFSGLKYNDISDTNKHNENNKSNCIIYKIASCIEQIHCLSLVLDDLPDMDNDSMRREKQSFHSKYGNEYTNFFIYYIFNHIGLSLDIVLDIVLDIGLDSCVDSSIDSSIESNSNSNSDNNSNINIDYEIASRINKLVTYNLNMLIDGQYNDLFYNMSKIDIGFDSILDSNIDINLDNDITNSLFHNEKDIILNLIGIEHDNYIDVKSRLLKNIDLNIKKTSSLFNLSICTGFLLQIWLNKCKYKSKLHIEIFDEIYNKLSVWSNILGYMFQISDDILDIDDDKEKGSPNLCNIIGKEKTCELLKKGCEWLKDMIINIYNKKNIGLDINLDIINEIIEKIFKRCEM